MAKKRKSLASSAAKEEAPSSSSSKPKPTKPPPESESDESSEEGSGEENDDVDEQRSSETSDDEEDEESESESGSEEEEEEDEGSKRETIKSLLEPFGKDQLISILREAAAANPSLVAGIVKAAESDPVHRKIFVHGLSWDTTSESLASFFAQFGAVEECKVVTDKATGRSKGYGFLLFETRAGARKALRQPQKKLGGRTAWCQLASAGPGPGPGASQPYSEPAGGGGGGEGGRKLYVANVGPQISPERLRAFFACFGEIEDGPLGMDKATGKFRGFALFMYKTPEGLKKALEEPNKVFEGFKLQCSVAVAKSNRGSSAAGGAPAVSVAGVAPETLGAANAGLPAMPVLNPGAVLMGQSPALGVLNPVLGMGYSPAFAAGVSPALNMKVGTTPTVGINAGFGLQQGVNAMSPSLIGGYGAQGALQGLGAYQSAQLGQPSAPGTASRPQHGGGTVGATPSYFGH